ncbi:hypothetical protein MHBO_000138 [Bonamia ostreae]|uniref:asparagine synthase (glutamine-hydrolyzing) n=1 Tax=Bonamia ostreae TaxID=126728 RepID=A0ABV2AEL2_9EUKA
MCGIFFYGGALKIRGKAKKELCERFRKLQHRGPDCSRVQYFNSNVMTGFHRLQVVDPTPAGMQPFVSSDGRFCSLVNGEIYNFREIAQFLKKKMSNYECKSDSDCEVVLNLFIYFLSKIREENRSRPEEEIYVETMRRVCKRVDGEYAIIIYDSEKQRVVFAVDELRVRPIFYGIDEDGGFYLSSEQKPLSFLPTISPVPAGSMGSRSVALGNKEALESAKISQHFDFESEKRRTDFKEISYSEAVQQLRNLLVDNLKRKLNPERSFAFLLSGGLDSSLVCAIASKLLAPRRIRTFTFGFSRRATDVIAAEEVAEYLDSIHETYIFNFEKGGRLVEEAIYFNESWDQTTTRASTAMLLGLKKMKKEHPEIAVVYSGEIADELLRGYLYNLLSPDPFSGRIDAIDRLRDISYFDGLRADRMVSSIGCELRLPFFSRSLLEFVLALPPEYIDPLSNQRVEKKILRDAFAGAKGEFLPEKVLWRTKHAMSDGTSEKDGWKDYLKSQAEKHVTHSRFEARAALYSHSTPQTKEDMWYREIFDSHGFAEESVPYKWMPSWCTETLLDSSATALSVFKEDRMDE